jgi:SOS-response transcriptional repressor LexA
MARQGRRRDHREGAKALAKAIHAAVDAYNRRFPNNPFAIDDATSRILENDPDYHPPRKRMENKEREPTVNPGIFTVLAIATRLETTLGELLSERGFELTKSDLRSFRWISDFFRMRFPIEEVPPLADERKFIEKDFSRPRAPRITKLKSKGQLAAGPTPLESDFEITEAVILGDPKSTSLVAAQVKGRSMMDRMRDGDTIVIDTARREPRQHEPVAVYVENEGGVLGYWRAEAGAYYLDKHNPDVPSYKLGHPSEWRVLGVITLVQSPVSRQDRPAIMR